MPYLYSDKQLNRCRDDNSWSSVLTCRSEEESGWRMDGRASLIGTNHIDPAHSRELPPSPPSPPPQTAQRYNVVPTHRKCSVPKGSLPAGSQTIRTHGAALFHLVRLLPSRRSARQDQPQRPPRIVHQKRDPQRDPARGHGPPYAGLQCHGRPWHIV